MATTQRRPNRRCIVRITVKGGMRPSFERVDSNANAESSGLRASSRRLGGDDERDDRTRTASPPIRAMARQCSASGMIAPRIASAARTRHVQFDIQVSGLATH